MKREEIIFRAALLIAALSFPIPSSAQPYYIPKLLSVEFQTVGGVTYLIHDLEAPNTSRTHSYQASRQGNRIELIVTEFETGSGFSFPAIQTHKKIAVLGSLPDGEYEVMVAARMSHSLGTSSIGLLQTNATIVNATTNTLQAISTNNERGLVVRGVREAIYVVEKSTNLVDWTGVHTNSGPFTYAVPNQKTNTRYFRTRILSTPPDL